jgi:hypothetical protein
MTDRCESHQIELAHKMMGEPVDHIQRHHFRDIRQMVLT